MLGVLGVSAHKLLTPLNRFAFLHKKVLTLLGVLRAPLTKYRVWQRIGGGTSLPVVAAHPHPPAKPPEPPQLKTVWGINSCDVLVSLLILGPNGRSRMILRAAAVVGKRSGRRMLQAWKKQFPLASVASDDTMWQHVPPSKTLQKHNISKTFQL